MKEKKERQPISKQEKILSYVIGSLILLLLLTLVVVFSVTSIKNNKSNTVKLDYATISRVDVNKVLHLEPNQVITSFETDYIGPDKDAYDPSKDTLEEFKKKEFYILLIDLEEKKDWKDFVITLAKNKKENIGFAIYDFSKKSNNKTVGVSNKVILQKDDNTLNDLLGLEKAEKTTEFGTDNKNLDYVEKNKHENKNQPILIKFVDGSLDKSSSIFTKENTNEKVEQTYKDIKTKLETLKK